MAESSHGSELAFQTDPVGAPATYATLREFSSDFVTKVTTDVHEFIAHNRAMAGNIPGILKVDPWTVNIGYEINEPTHINLKAKQFSKQQFKMRFRGPDGGPGVDEFIMSGFLSSWQATAPTNGLRAGEMVFQPNGRYLEVDGVVYVDD